VSGGILVREGKGTKSKELPARLSTGAYVEELELDGERLHYKLIPGKGDGPEEGWISLKLKATPLVEVKEDLLLDIVGPVDPEGELAVDEAMKEKIEALSKTARDDLDKYVPKYKVYKFPLSAPKYRVFCFHNAGSAETNYSAKKTPFTDWVTEAGSIEFLSLQYPGRENLLKEPKHSAFDTLCPLLLSVVYDKIADGTPYFIWGHSVGTWVAFELLMLARRIGLPMPKAAMLNAFAAPHLPHDKVPWHKSRKLSAEKLKDELLNWDKDHFGGAGKIVFREEFWASQWEPLMRADFQLFDDYQFKHNGAPKFDFPLHAWHMEKEHYSTADMIEMWGDWTTKDFDFQTIPKMGHLTCFYNPEFKKEFFSKIVGVMKGYCDL